MKKPKKNKILVYMRGGHVITLYCDHWSTKKTTDGRFSGFAYEGLDNGPVSLSLPDIVGWQQVDW